MPERIRVEVAYAEPQRQWLLGVELAGGARVAEAIAACGIERDAGIDVSAMTIGIWSKPVQPSTVLHDGDRIELYRPLKADPKESRRRRAARAKEPRA